MYKVSGSPLIAGWQDISDNLNDWRLHLRGEKPQSGAYNFWESLTVPLISHWSVDFVDVQFLEGRA